MFVKNNLSRFHVHIQSKGLSGLRREKCLCWQNDSTRMKKDKLKKILCTFINQSHKNLVAFQYVCLTVLQYSTRNGKIL